MVTSNVVQPPEQTSEEEVYCLPLITALIDGIGKRFNSMLVAPESVAAAILLPKMKTTWTADHMIINAGINFIKAHLAIYDSEQNRIDSNLMTTWTTSLKLYSVMIMPNPLWSS